MRHRLDTGNWHSIFRRLEELVVANSGEDEFSEIFKLLVAKLLVEMSGQAPLLLRATPGETHAHVNRVLAQATRKWPGILGDDHKSRLEPDHLQVCVEAIDELLIKDTSLEVMDGVFEFLVSRSSKGAKGQYFTPRHVIEACVQIIDPRPEELILDPASGSAGFLVHAMQHVAAEMPDSERSSYSARNLWGFDIDQRAVQVGKALTLIAGGDQANLFRLNSLVTPESSEGLFAIGDIEHGSLTIEDVARGRLRGFKGFDVIITNPPFAGEVREEGLLRGYELARPSKRNERDVLFIERCVSLLKPGGRLAIVLPTNKVGSKGSTYIREWLLKRMRVVAVLSLGRSTFQPHTSQKAEVIFAVKREARLRTLSGVEEPILFLTSESPGKDGKGNIIFRASGDSGGALWERADHDLDDAVEEFKSFIGQHHIQWGASNEK